MDTVGGEANSVEDNNPVKFLAPARTYDISRVDLVRHSTWFHRHLTPTDHDTLPPGWQHSRLPPDTGYTHMFIRRTQPQFKPARPLFRDIVTGDMNDILAPELSAFFSVLQAVNFDNFQTFDLGTTDMRKWVAILKIARLWEFPGIVALAVERVGAILSASPAGKDTSFERLILARAFAVEEWVERALVGLVNREIKLNRNEMESMWPEDLEHVVSAREEALRREIIELQNGASNVPDAHSPNGHDVAANPPRNGLFGAPPSVAAVRYQRC